MILNSATGIAGYRKQQNYRQKQYRRNDSGSIFYRCCWSILYAEIYIEIERRWIRRELKKGYFGIPVRWDFDAFYVFKYRRILTIKNKFVLKCYRLYMEWLTMTAIYLDLYPMIIAGRDIRWKIYIRPYFWKEYKMIIFGQTLRTAFRKNTADSKIKSTWYSGISCLNFQVVWRQLWVRRVIFRTLVKENTYSNCDQNEQKDKRSWVKIFKLNRTHHCICTSQTT